jgi:transcriptional regulator with XRE-family HTH domain
VAEDQERGPFANEIREALYRTRILEIAELARRAAMDRPQLSQVVNGWRLPSAEQLDAICEALGWTPEQLYPNEAFRAAIEATRREAGEPA